jgi:hypothetical protein
MPSTVTRVLLLLAALLTALVPGAGAGALDNANVADAEHAPTLRESEPFVATVAVRNPYDRAAKVKLLDPSCSCATLEISSTFILPHQTADLHIAVLNHDRSGPQHIGVTVFLTDPEFEAIEVNTYWSVRATVQVDALPPAANPLARPEDKAWQDIYQYVAKARPDELSRLRKRIRLSCPPEELPAGGLKVLAIDYPGTLWRFVPTTQSDGSILILATARDAAATVAEGELTEKVVVHTNHPDKQAITLIFLSEIAKDAGTTSRDPAR